MADVQPIDRDYTLPDGRRLHIWADEDGLVWVCLMAEGVCLGCDSDPDGLLLGCVENLLDGRMTVEWEDGRGFVFSITEAGERYVEQMLDEGGNEE